MIRKNEKLFFLILLLLVTGKMIFVGSNVDEGYAIELCYRLAKGDRLITEMWEPHQTSAIFGALLVKLYWLFSAETNTGIVLFMHMCGAICQLSVAYYLYKVIKQEIPDHIAFYLSIFYALCYPKGVIAPDYSNLQNWFVTLMVLFLIQARKKAFYYILVGVCLSGAVLAYPSMILLYPMVILLVWTEDSKLITKKEKKNAILYITITCGALAMLFIGYLLSYANVKEILQGIRYVLQDGSHSEGLISRMSEVMYYAGTIAIRIGIYCLIAFALQRFFRKRDRNNSIYIIVILLSLAIQILYWLLRDEFVNQPQTEIVFMAIVGMALMRKSKSVMPRYMIVCSATGLIGTIILSNFKLIELVVYLALATIGGVIALYFDLESDNREISISLKTLMMAWIVILSFGRVWVTSQGGELHTTPFEVRNVQKFGPGIGIFTNYMTGHRYNTIADQWDELVKEGEAVFYVGPSSYYYMFGDVVISAPNTISTPVYEANILDYWEKYPERYPDVVLVESCYGELIYPDDSFIIRWLNTEYQPSEVIEKEYVQVYRK